MMSDHTDRAKAASAAPLTGEELRSALAGLIGVPAAEIADDANLIQLGLESLQVMRLATKWRRAGLSVAFGDLAADPTFAAWNERVTRELAEKSA
ncbi:phosphopantetheine-binding protein [Streptomyces sp. P9(2023)]|uniref:phosphopantetheine-binding protein n=1 Tax=Streptomyces sp. P9(2023) TaxID=3064394 RepID=UPI0028F447C1|nr:phosphopantetheine-binding protein [Streptomyces sp. P9(2023)]MDT9691493.1 phosphopantetheine-binding protein [Streptomyces sp. P9(2023)]